MTMAAATQTNSAKFYPKQGQFIVTPAHFAAFVAGIGSGKTVAGAARGFLASNGYIGKRRIIPVPNVGMVTAPSYTMLRDATLRAYLEILETANAIQSFNKNDMEIRLKNRSEILFRSAHEPERLRGPSIAWWHGDEAALYQKIVFQLMIGRLRQFGMLGYAWLTTTPKGKDYLYNTFVRDNYDNPDYFLRQASSKDNIFLERGIIAAWENSYVGDFARQELEGEFVAFEGLVYPEFDEALHVTERRPEKFARVIAGVDWGFTNPGVIVVGGLDHDLRLYFTYEEYQRQVLIDDWVRIAGQLQAHYGIEAFYCDPSDPDAIAAFENAGLRAHKANNTVNTGIQRVKARLVRQADGLPRMFFNRSMVNAISEFNQYQWATKGDMTLDAPTKANDHAMDAIRYLTMAVDMPEEVGVLVPDVGSWIDVGGGGNRR